MGFSAITLGFCRPRVTVNAVQFKKGLRVFSVSLCIHIIYIYIYICGPQNGWFTMENPIKMDDLVVILF